MRKQNQLSKKLNLQKRTIVKLNANRMRYVGGGSFPCGSSDVCINASSAKCIEFGSLIHMCTTGGSSPKCFDDYINNYNWTRTK